MVHQLVLITDGRSNAGTDPVAAAAYARAEGIVVHVVGVVDDGAVGERGAAEAEEIARAGGGLCRIVRPRVLSATVQQVTRQTVIRQLIDPTVRSAAREGMPEPAGVRDLTLLPPSERAVMVSRIEAWADAVPLRVALLVDASGSMKPKFAAVREAVFDLALGLRSRRGPGEIAVFHYPAPGGAALDVGWTNDPSVAGRLFERLEMRGMTPTGPAILRVVDFFAETDGESLRDYVV